MLPVEDTLDLVCDGVDEDVIGVEVTVTEGEVSR